MLEHAVELGANGIVAMRYDTSGMSEDMTEVLAYGTAVVIRAEAARGASE
jgi:uncharacterized protein YbjQ (UPF0145 family)